MSGSEDAATYHDRTKHSPQSVRESGRRLDFENKPRPYKVYEDLPRIDLPGPSDLPEVPTLQVLAGRGERPSDATVDRGTVADLCHYAVGVTKTVERRGEEIPFRAAACTGALYHVDLYAVCGDLQDLDAGVYHYDPRDHALDVVREGDSRDALAAATAGESRVTEAPLSIVATSTWWRNAWKYRERTYRHAFWDSGTSLANLLAVADLVGHPAGVVAGFADGAVADLVGVDPEREAPLEVVPVGAGAPVDRAEDPAVDPIGPETRPLSRDEKRFDLIVEAYRGSSLSDPEAVADWRGRAIDSESGAPDRPWLAPSGDGERVSLDPVGDDRASKVPLDHTIRRRGSCREYERATLDGRKVATVLDRAVRPIPFDVGEGANGTERGGAAGPSGGDAGGDGDARPLRFSDCYLIVHDVEGIPPGAYHYRTGTDGPELERLREGEFREEAGHLALDQRLAADAGLVAFFVTDLTALRDRLGDRGYRVAQLEAGIAMGRLYLAAYAHADLGATGLTFYDDEVARFFAPRTEGQTPLVCWTLGRPA